MIKILDQATINKIAAGEVVERPSSVVKELVENAIDSGATAVTIEIKDGGVSFIRVTDNGFGIEKNDVPTAFVRHATSKILSIEDLLSIQSLGFRGEALASIAAVSQVECITKTAHALTGIRYEVHGSKEISCNEIGAPIGTTLIIRNLFYNVPARKKFLKSAITEAGYITDLVIKLALSKPNISFKYIINGSNKIATSGNGKLKDVIYHIYGKEVSTNLLPIKREIGQFKVEGYVGKAFVSKGNRSFEHYFVNGRSIRSGIVTKAIEEAYKSFVMIHKFPFTSLHFTLDSNKLDVNVHPTKMEFKYAEGDKLFNFVKESVRYALLQEEMIPDVSLRTSKEEKAITLEQQKKNTTNVPEAFENNARSIRYQNELNKNNTASVIVQPINESLNNQISKNFISNTNNEEKKSIIDVENSIQDQSASNINQSIIDNNDLSIKNNTLNGSVAIAADNTNIIESDHNIKINSLNQTEQDIKFSNQSERNNIKPEQLSMPVDIFISKEARKKHRIIGQLFKTYWLIEYEKKLYIIDQHAAHEKVMFERLMKQMSEKNIISQQLLPPKVLHLSGSEHNIIIHNIDLFIQTGFDIEDFGDDSIIVRAMPDDIMGVDPQLLFDALLNSLVNEIGKIDIDFFVEKLSGMACKAAIKGNSEISIAEADALIDELLTLKNPYNCPHGRPTTITITQTELERKFKRIQDK